MTFQDIYYPSFGGATFSGSWNKTKYQILNNIIENINKIFLKLYDKNNNLKYVSYYNSEVNWIQNIELEINKNGSGLCEITFTDRIELDIQAEDILEVYFGDKIIYKGFAVNDLDFYSKKAQFLGFSKKLQDWTVNAVYTNKTIAYILQNIITLFTTKTTIKYDSKFVDTGSNEPFSFEFKNEKIFEVVNKLVNLLQDRYWFVDENNYLNVKKIKKDKIDKYFMLNTHNKMFNSISIKFDYSNIEATQYKVFRNSNDGGSQYVGQVGNVGNINYPPLPISSKIRPIESVFNVSEVVNNTTALKLAYADLKQKAKIKQSINVKQVNLNYFTPHIDDYCYFEYYTTGEKIKYNNILLEDNEITKIGNNLYNIKSLIDEKIIILEQEYDFVYFRIYNLNFLNYLTFDFLDKDDNLIKRYTVYYPIAMISNNTKKIQILHYGFQPQFEFNCEVWGFKKNINFLIDNVVKIRYNISDRGISCDFSCGDLVQEEGDELYNLKKKVRILETINNI